MKIDKDFIKEVQERSGQNIKTCYQCLKCSVGCPVFPYMEFKTNSVIRLIQYGEREKVLRSSSIWLCVSCMTCGVRCPNEIDMSTVMDTLREMSIEDNYAYEADRRVVILHEEFVRSVKMWGRLHEVTFFIPYMVRSLDLFSNMGTALALMPRGKFPLMPKQIEGIEEIRQLFDRAYKTKGQLKREE
jgi:heterodisulfide reductase subunit C